jgi:uncharacterized protein (DUF2147 family)
MQTTARALAIVTLLLVAHVGVAAAESPVGRWKTVDDKTGKVRSEVEIYEQGGKIFGKIVSLSDPLENGKPRTCVKCPGADKDKPVVGLVIIRDLSLSGDRYKGGTIMDPEDGKVYRAEIWVENGELKVRGYVAFFYRTQTWPRAR